VSINLSTEDYGGGILQIRERESEKIVSEIPNLGSGDAIVFRLAPHLQHRITEIEGKADKTAFAGWFRARPNFLSLLKGVTEQNGVAESRQSPGPPNSQDIQPNRMR
jgi:hypothetical protein